MSDHPADPASRAPRPDAAERALAAPAGAAPAGAAPADWDALARLLADEPVVPASDAAARATEARQWMAAHPDEAARLARLDVLVVAHLTPPSAPVDVEAALARVKAALPASAPPRPPLSSPPHHVRPTTSAVPELAPPRLPPRRPAWATRRLAQAGAAAVVLLAAAGLLRRPHDRTPDPASAATTTPATEHRYATRTGARDSLRLPDGTRVVLGPATTLIVAASYGTIARQVTLDGEAYFQVVHDSARPFTVHAGPAAVHDVGTAFIVRGTPAGRVVVAVTEGVVRLEALPGDTGPAADAAQPPLRLAPAPRSTRPPADSTTVLLRAGDRGLVTRPAASSGVHSAAARVSRLAPAAGPADDLAWTTGRLVFRDAALSEVADALRRWYGVDLRVTDPALADRHLTASFQGEPLGEVLRIVGLALGARLDRRGDTVFVRGGR